VLRIRIRYPVLFLPLDPGSGINIPDYISSSLETIFGVKILEFFDADLDPESGIFLTLDPGPGIKKNFGSGINVPDPQH
jgi:hypothetical protein